MDKEKQARGERYDVLGIGPIKGRYKIAYDGRENAQGITRTVGGCKDARIAEVWQIVRRQPLTRLIITRVPNLHLAKIKMEKAIGSPEAFFEALCP